MASKLFQPFIRISSFLRKEVFEILRQPRLLLTLVLGPFLILLVFGVGYRNEARALRTLFVAPANSPLRERVEEFATTLGPQLIFAGVTGNESAALDKLRSGDVDLVAVAPGDALDTIRNSQPATFILFHREIDPLQVDYVNYFGQVYIDEVNRRVLLRVTQQGQREASDVRADLQQARVSAVGMRQALLVGNSESAQRHQNQLESNVDSVAFAVGASLGLLSGVEETVGNGNEHQATDLLTTITGLQGTIGSLEEENPSSRSVEMDRQLQIARLLEIENDLAQLETQLEQFTALDPNVIVRPFRSEARSIAAVQPTPLDFFAPAVIALLLQHLAVTFGALSIVRERSTGTVELFRVAPLSSMETLIGKYLSYLIFSALLAAALSALLFFGLNVPFLGSWLDYSLVILALIFTSLGIGFVVSLLSQTDSQAVQLTMIVLLTSVFFSGFIVTLDLIWAPVRVLSWSLPTTYGIILLRDIMLRGDTYTPLLLAGLTAIGAFLFFAAWLMLRSLISSK